MPKKAPKAPEAEPVTTIPAEQREFTTRERGGHVVYLQRMEVEPNGNKGNRTVKRAITVRLQRGIKFDPFVECGPEGKNANFRDITPEAALAALQALEADRASPVVYWDDRPMTEEQSEHAKQLKVAGKALDEQKEANAKLRSLLEENGLKVPEDI